MHFATSFMAIVGAAALASAGTVKFWTLDDVQRTIYFTPNPGSAELEPVVVNNKEKKVVQFPDTYVGNFYAIPDGEENIPGMLGEVNFSGWNGLTYFDVSAIVKPTDTTNIKQMWAAESKSPMSGCEVWPCDNAYWHADDVQTKTTMETNIVVTLGEGSTGMSF